MNKIKKIAILLSLSLFFVIPAKADNSFPGFPMSFYGTVTVDGLPLPGDSKVQVFSGNNMIGEVSINDNGVYGYDDPMKIKLVVNNFTEDLIFKYLVNDSESQTGLLVQKYTEGFQSGKSVLKNLLFVTKKTPQALLVAVGEEILPFCIVRRLFILHGGIVLAVNKLVLF